MRNQFLTVAAQQINYRNFNHGITSGLLFHGGTCHANQHLCGKSRIINLHVKLEQLIMGLARYPFTNQVNAMTASASLNIGASASDKCEREFLFSPSSIVTRYMASKKSSECR